MKGISLVFFLLLVSVFVNGQQPAADTTRTLDSVIIRSFEQFKSPAKLSAQICAVAQPLFEYTSKASLLSGMNTVAGVRMEERSPGSYRINIRGSSLRSPFGVRNVKVYWNGFPVTDPGGNTYFNQFVSNNFSYIEITKGPAASMYGAGTGGLIMLESGSNYMKPQVSVEYNAGSFNQQNLFASYKQADGKNRQVLSFAHNSSDGFRDHSAFRRNNVSWYTELKQQKNTFRAGLLFADLFYETPGALTLAEFNKDPAAARPATGALPSAATARAAIYQQNLLIGLSNDFKIARNFSNTTVVYGAYASVKNPAIRNYEKRTEPSFGGRTVFTFSKRVGDFTKLTLNSGAEIQQGYFNTRVSKNRNGNPDTLLTDDDTRFTPVVIFLQASADFYGKFFITGGLGLNETNISITRTNSYPVRTQKRNYKSQLTPRITASFELTRNFTWLAGLSKGFSPPTVSEVLPSTGVINTELDAENGWNMETTIRYSRFKKPSFGFELTGFTFHLKDALVSRRDLSGADFFVNAGDIRQRGIELHTNFSNYMFSGFFKEYTLTSYISVSHFRYGSFIKGTDDFSGNKVPSVPASVLSIMGEITTRPGIYLRASYYGSAPVWLNDANTAKAPAYHLLGTQMGWKKKEKGALRLSVYAGVDNLLDEIYSPGNDINAAGGRYYNAAPRRNFYTGLQIQWVKLKR